MFYQFQHFGISESFSKEVGENFSYPVHLHQSFEFIYIVSGEMQVNVDNKVYELKKGEAVIIFPNQIHSLTSQNSKHVLYIFSGELIKAFASKYQSKVPKNNKFSPNEYLISVAEKIDEKSSSFEKKGLFYSLCAEFDKSTEYDKRSFGDNDILRKIFEFVENNYKKDCSLEELSKNTAFSYSYLSRYFKRMTGVSFNEYVNTYRISNACYMLTNSNETVLHCALESGYSSLRSFNRNFKLNT